MVLHVDKVKHCTGTTPVLLLGMDNYNVVPVTLEPDVLTNMFGDVDRSGGSRLPMTRIRLLSEDLGEMRAYRRNSCVEFSPRTTITR